MPTHDLEYSHNSFFLLVVYGSWFDHVLSWEEHKNDENILIIFYEEMKKVSPS